MGLADYTPTSYENFTASTDASLLPASFDRTTAKQTIALTPVTEAFPLHGLKEYEKLQQNVIDGDTIRGEQFGLAKGNSVRMQGYNAPEMPDKQYKDEVYVDAALDGTTTPEMQLGLNAKRDLINNTFAMQKTAGLQEAKDRKLAILSTSSRDANGRLLGDMYQVQNGEVVDSMSAQMLKAGNSNVWIEKNDPYKVQKEAMERNVLDAALAKAQNSNDDVDWASYENLIQRTALAPGEKRKYLNPSIPVAKTVANAVVGAGEVVSAGGNYAIELATKLPKAVNSLIGQKYVPGKGWVENEDTTAISKYFAPAVDAVEKLGKSPSVKDIEKAFTPIRESLNDAFNTDVFSKMEVYELPSVAKAIHDAEQGRYGAATVQVINSILQGLVNKENAAMMVPWLGQSALVLGKAKEFKDEGSSDTKALAYGTAYTALNKLGLQASLGQIKALGNMMLGKVAGNMAVEELTENLQSILELDAAGKINSVVDVAKSLRDTTREVAPSALFGGVASIATDTKDLAKERLQNSTMPWNRPSNETVVVEQPAQQQQQQSGPTNLTEKYGTPETAKSTVDATIAEFNKAIEDNKIGTANKILTKLYEDIKIDTEGHIDRGVFTAAKDLVVEKNAQIAARIADNNGEIDEETMRILGSDKDSIDMMFRETPTAEIEQMVSKLSADADKGVVSRLKALVVERKTLEQVGTQIGADIRRYWDNIKHGTIDSDKEAALGNMVRLASNEIDKVSKMQADIEEVESRIRSDIEARPSATANDFTGSKTVQYPAGGSYVINYRNIAEKVLSENTDKVVRNGVYKTLDKVKDEATAAKRVTTMAMRLIDKTKKPKNEVASTGTLDTTTSQNDNVVEPIVEPTIVDEVIVDEVVEPTSTVDSAQAVNEVFVPVVNSTQTKNKVVNTPKGKKESVGRKLKAAAEIRIGEGEDEAAARVKAIFKPEDEVKNYAKSLSKEDLAELARLAEEDKVARNNVDDNVAVTSALAPKYSRGEAVLSNAPMFNRRGADNKMESVNLADEVYEDSGNGIDTSKLSEETGAVFDNKVQTTYQYLYRVLQQLAPSTFSHVQTVDNPFLMFVDHNKKTGNFTVSKEIAEAFTVGLTAYVGDKYGMLRNNDDTQIQKMLGVTSWIPSGVRSKLQKQGRLLDNEADSLGRLIVNAMGIKAKEDADYDAQERLASSVGAVAMMVMQELGMVEIDNKIDAAQLEHMGKIAKKEMVDGEPASLANMPKYDPLKAVSFVNMTSKYSAGNKSAKWLDTAMRNKELITKLQDEIGAERFTKEPRLDKKTRTKEFKTRNAESWTNITEEQMAALNKAQNTPFKANMEAIGDLVSMWGENSDELTPQQVKVAELFGYSSVEGKHIDRHGGITAKNNDIVESIQALVDFSKVADGRKVYFDYFFSKNGRFFMDSNTINPQTDKLHRFLVTVEASNTTIDDSSRDTYKIAIVQAFDQEKDVSSTDEDGTELRDIGAIDKQSQEDSVRQFDGIVGNVKIQEALEAIRTDAENKAEKILAAVSNAKHPGHALAALRALVNYKENENFDADITMETDGTTSGFLLGLMTNPVMEFSKLVKWLAKGGVWVGDGFAETYGAWKANPDNKDGYETSAIDINTAVMNSHKVTRPGVVDFVGTVSRSFMKNPLMIFVYGAGINRITKEIGQQNADKMIDNLSAGKSFGSMKMIIEDEVAVLREERAREGLKKQEIFNIDKQIRELAALEKFISGNVDRVAKAIREESIAANGNVAKIHKLVSSVVEKTYGFEVGNYLENTFGELVAMRKAMNSVFDVSYKVFIDEFNKRSKELQGSRKKLTRLQLDVLLGDMVEEGKIPGILTVEASSRDEKAPIMKERKQPGLGDESKVQVGYVKDGSRTTRTVHPMIYKMLANSTAGSVINIHYLDGAIIGKIIADGQGFGIHDAFVAHVNDVIGNVKKYNENVWTMTQEYDMLQRTIDELQRVHRLNPKIVEEYYTIVVDGQDVMVYDSRLAELASMVDTVNLNKQELANRRVVSAQMAGPIGSTFDKPGIEEVVSKPNSVGNSMAAVGLVRSTEGMAKENSDILAASIKLDCKVNK